jgi:hypothetical protein
MIDGIMTDPTLASILAAHVELDVNAASSFSARGDGIPGILALTISKEYYTTRSIDGVAFKAPTPPTEAPTHVHDVTEAHIAEANRKHKAHGIEYTMNYYNMDKALCNQLIKAAPAIFFAAICDPVIGLE